MDAGTVRAWAHAAARALDAARAPIDSLNVFPVPDGDTGTNLALTVAEAAEHVGDDHTSAADVAAAFARGALLGARGNSGIIVSQYLHGFAVGLADGEVAEDGVAAGALADDGVTGAGLADGSAHRGAGPENRDAVVVARALHRAQLAARAAVARPVDGTILTAAEAAAVAAGAAACDGADTRATVSAAVAGAREALARGPETLDVLRAAGVVDAGAAGLVVLLGALAGVLGDPVSTATSTLRTVSAGDSLARASAARVDPQSVDPWPAGTPHPRDDGEFEVMYVVTSERDDLAPGLSGRLTALGTSVAVVGGADGWHVHVHTDDPVAAVAAGAVGERSQVVVRRLDTPTAADGLGVIAGTSAPGLVADLARTGALVLVHAERPITARDVRRAVVDTAEPHVVVLPGSSAGLIASVTAARAGADVRGGVGVEVLDATDDVRVVVALAADPGAGDRVAAMRAALAGARTADVDEPDVDAVLACARSLLDDDGELVTVLRGAALDGVVDATGLRAALTEGLALTHPDAEVVVLDAGQAAPAAAVAVE